jgi:hypothetical protein
LSGYESPFLKRYDLGTSFLVELGHDVGAFKLMQDNKSSIIMLNKGMNSSEKTRHIAIRFFFVNDLIESHEVVLEHMPTELMTADVLIKPL